MTPPRHPVPASDRAAGTGQHPLPLELDADTDQLLHLLATVWRTSPTAALRRLIDGHIQPVTTTSDGPALVALHYQYGVRRVTAVYVPATQAVLVPGGQPGAGLYASPRAAARAVSAVLSPHFPYCGDGLSFWRLAERNLPLRAALDSSPDPSVASPPAPARHALLRRPR